MKLLIVDVLSWIGWKRIIAQMIGLLCYISVCNAQFTYGTTGLLHAPTAEMQRDKTFMFGGNYLDKHPMAHYWSGYDEYSPFTFNYYVNMTMFPWLEIGYACTLVKGIHNSSYWPQQTWGKFTNQDRSFHFRLRAWKEGWWRTWTPQIVIGANDLGSHASNGGGGIDLGGGGSGNHNYLTRYYLAGTKHFGFDGVGTLGAHVAWIIGRAMGDVHYSRPSIGVNFQFGVKNEGFCQKALNGLNLMAEVCPGHADDLKTAAYNVNVGGTYSIWKDHINLIAELNDGKYFSGGIYFKIHLK
jgi:hypothetical protein